MLYYVYIKGNLFNKCYIKYSKNLSNVIKIFKKQNIVSIYTDKYLKIY